VTHPFDPQKKWAASLWNAPKGEMTKSVPVGHGHMEAVQSSLLRDNDHLPDGNHLKLIWNIYIYLYLYRALSGWWFQIYGFNLVLYGLIWIIMG